MVSKPDRPKEKQRRLGRGRAEDFIACGPGFGSDRTLHRSHAWPVRVYDWSLLLTTLEKSCSRRGSLTLGPAGEFSPGLSAASPGRLGGRAGGIAAAAGTMNALPSMVGSRSQQSAMRNQQSAFCETVARRHGRRVGIQLPVRDNLESKQLGVSASLKFVILRRVFRSIGSG